MKGQCPDTNEYDESVSYQKSLNISILNEDSQSFSELEHIIFETAQYHDGRSREGDCKK